MITSPCRRRRRPRLLLVVSISLSLALLLPTTSEARRNSNSVRRQNGRPRRTQATGTLPFLAMPGNDAILKPTFDENPGVQLLLPFVNGHSKEAELFSTINAVPTAAAISASTLKPYEGAQLVFHPHVATTTTSTIINNNNKKNDHAALMDEFEDDGGNEDDPTKGKAPYDGDDETTDSVLALSLLGLVLWISLSALLVARFVQIEKRRELMLKFWRAIDTNPDLRSAVEEAAGGAPFPKIPRHAGLHRFLRATAVALIVTMGLNLVFLMGRSPVPSSAAGGGGGQDGGGGGTGGGTEGGGGGGGGDNLPLDPTMGDDDGSGGNNPVVGVVVLFLLGASLVLIGRGLYAACCCASSNSSSSSSSSSSSRGLQSSYPGAGGVGGSYEPVHPSSVTPYVSMHGSSSSSSSPAQEVYYVGVPILSPSSPSAQQQQQQQQQLQHGGAGGEGEGGIEEGAPPPYSAALVAAPASTARVV